MKQEISDIQKIDVLNVVNTFFTIPYFFGNQFEYLNSKGYNIHIICSHSTQIENYSISKKFCYKEVKILRKISPIQDIISIILICYYIKQNNIKIVCGHTPKGALLSMISSYLMRVPKRVYFRHGIVYETSSGITRKILIISDRITSFLATKIICVSKSVANQSIEDNLNKISKQTILFNGTCNGIETNIFNRKNIDQSIVNVIRRKYFINSNDFIIGFSGRLVKDKGIIELFEAFEFVAKKFNNIKLLLVGTFDQRDELEKTTIEKITNNKNVIITGYIEYEQIPNYYFLMDVFVLPSYREGFPTSVLEASSMEIPILTTQATGCIDSIVENKTGFFINHSPSNIAEKIIYLIENKDIRSKLGITGRKFVSDKFSNVYVWNEILRIYNE